MYGTDEQRASYLPAHGDRRDPLGILDDRAARGLDVQAISTPAVRDGDSFVITGQKMWATNGLRSNLVMLLAKTDPTAEPRAPRDDRVPDREGADGRRAARPDRAAAAQEAGLQGRREHRARVRRFRHTGRRACSAARARSVKASSSSWAGSSSAGSTSRPAASASQRRHSKRRFATPRSARRSASRSRPTRRSSSSSPRWRRRSRHRGC